MSSGQAKPGVIEQQAQAVTSGAVAERGSGEKNGNAPACQCGRGVERLAAGYLVRRTYGVSAVIQADKLI
jgi:hypothetical protein